jgi:hypothetical protein
MRKILLLIVLCCSINASAQRIDKPGETYDYFCNVQHSVDGEGIVYMPEYDKSGNYLIICDSIENPLKFNSLGSVLVYMSKRGWEYIDTEHSKAFGLPIAIALMKKRVTDDSQAMEYLRLKPKYGTKRKKKED